VYRYSKQKRTTTEGQSLNKVGIQFYVRSKSVRHFCTESVNHRRAVAFWRRQIS